MLLKHETLQTSQIMQAASKGEHNEIHRHSSILHPQPLVSVFRPAPQLSLSFFLDFSKLQTPSPSSAFRDNRV